VQSSKKRKKKLLNKPGRGSLVHHVLAPRGLVEEDHLDLQLPDRLDRRREDHQKVDLVGHREAVDHQDQRKAGPQVHRRGGHPDRRKEDHPDRRKEGHPDLRKGDHPDHRREDHQKAVLRDRRKEDHQKEDHPDQKREDRLVLKEALRSD
jgi:hypothetical protein